MISLSEEEFTKLTALKNHWESWTGHDTDWGAFLMQLSAFAAPATRSHPLSAGAVQFFTGEDVLPSSAASVLEDALQRIDNLEKVQPMSEIDRLLAE